MGEAQGVLELRAGAEPAVVGVLRRQVRRWLAETVDDADVVEDLVLAVSEAVENVVDHAFVGATEHGTVTVRAVRDGDQVTITVGDDGRWQPARDGHHRGRGLALIEQLADHSVVDAGPGGTTVTLQHRP